VVDRSIGPISIGLPERRVLGLLGRPLSSFRSKSAGDAAGTVAQYRSKGGELLIGYDSSGHVASIETYSPGYRTGSGVGPGSSLALAARLPGFRADPCDLGYWNATGRTRRGAVVTVFVPEGGLVESVTITRLRLDTNCDEAGRGLEPRPRIVVDRSIDGISLGMPEAAVVKALGTPLSTRPARHGSTTTGKLARYAVEGAPSLVGYNTGGHVVSVRGFSTAFFTPAGIGPGSPRAAVAALRGFAADPCRSATGTARLTAAPPGRSHADLPSGSQRSKRP
jgi:hypothetical protein